MHELTQQLEQLFGASILFMEVNSNPGIQAASFQLGHIYSQTGAPTRLVTLRLAQKSLLQRELPKFDMLRAFDGIMRHACVKSVRLEVSTDSPYPIQTVEFTIYDFDNFMNDMKNHQWNAFSGQFTEQLDKVLEEEE